MDRSAAVLSPSSQPKHNTLSSRTSGMSRSCGRVYPPGFPVMRPHQVSCKKAQFRNKLSSLYRFSKTKTYFEQCFHIVRVLGNGSFGQVLHVKSKESGKDFAVKRALRTFESCGKRYRQLQEVFNHEVIPHHINIIQFERAWEERGRLYIQTELCGTTLQSYRVHYGPLMNKELWTVLIDTLRALHHLHSEKMLHLDVKPSNIYISLDRMLCKVGDFGLSLNLKEKSNKCADDGDRNYMAPELLNGPPTTAADLYSLGITMLELSTTIDIDATRCLIRSGRIPRSPLKGVTDALRHEISSLLKRQPKSRPTPAEVLGRVKQLKVQRAIFRELQIQPSPLDKDYFLDKDWDFESEDVIHPPSLRAKRKYNCTAFGASTVRKRLVFDELAEDELPSPKSEASSVGPNTPVFARVLEFNGSPSSPPPKKVKKLPSPEGSEETRMK